jgi:hypothetical protein
MKIEMKAVCQRAEKLCPGQHLHDQQDFDDGDHDRAREAGKDPLRRIEAEQVPGKQSGDRNDLDPETVKTKQRQHQAQKDQQGCLFERHGRAPEIRQDPE